LSKRLESIRYILNKCVYISLEGLVVDVVVCVVMKVGRRRESGGWGGQVGNEV